MFNINFKPFSINFLLEASIESIEKNNEEKLSNLLGHSKHKSWTDFIASSFDPTYPKQNKYTLWMINGLLRKQFDLNDLDNAKNILDHFDKNSKFYPKQLTQYKTIQEIESDAKSAVSNSKDNSKLIKKYVDAGNELLYSDTNGNFMFRSPTFIANQVFKSVTSWCTTRDEYHFDRYSDNGLYVICIDNRLYQFNLDDESTIDEFKDADDSDVTDLMRIRLYNSAPEIFKIINDTSDWHTVLHIKDSAIDIYDSVVTFTKSLSDKTSQAKRDFIKFLNSKNFTSILSLYQVNDTIQLSVYDIIAFISGEGFEDIKYIIGYNALSFEHKRYSAKHTEFYSRLDYKLWGKIILDIVKRTNNVPEYYKRRLIVGTFDDYYIPLSYAIIKQPELMTSIPLPDHIIAYYSIADELYADYDMFYHKASSILNITKSYDNVVKGYYNKVVNGTNKLIKDGILYISLIPKLYANINNDKSAYMDVLSAVLCNTNAHGFDVFTDNMLKSFDYDCVSDIIRTYSNAHKEVPPGFITRESYYVFELAEYMSYYIIKHKDNIDFIFKNDSILRYYLNPLNGNRKYYKDASSIVSDYAYTRQFSSNDVLNMCLRIDAECGDDISKFIKFKNNDVHGYRNFIELCGASDYIRMALMVKNIIVQCYYKRPIYDTGDYVQYNYDYPTAAIKVITKILPLTGLTIDVNSEYARLLVIPALIYMIRYDEYDDTELKKFLSGVNTNYALLPSVLDNNSRNLFNEYIEIISKCIKSDGVTLSAKNYFSESMVNLLINDDVTFEDAISGELNYVDKKSIYAIFDFDMYKFSTSIICGDVYISIIYNEPSKKVKCQIKYNHGNINTAVITNPKVLQQWFNNAMLYTIKRLG